MADRPLEVVKGGLHALGEHLQVGAAVPVGDRGEVELAGVGEHGHRQGQVAHDGRHREQLQQPRPGQVQRHRRPGDVGDDEVHRPLAGQEPVPGTLDGDEPQEPAAHRRAGPALAGGGLGGDQLEPAHRVGLAQRQRHQHDRVPVAARPPRLLPMERDRHHHPQRQLLDVLAAAGQQLAQAAGHGGQDDVVDLGLVGVGDLPGHLQAAPDDGQPAVGPDRAVEAGAGGTLGQELTPHPQRGAPRPARTGQARQPPAQPAQAPAQVVDQQLPHRRPRGRRPRRRDLGGRVRVQVQQRAEGRHPGHPVGQGVMGAQEQADLPARQPGQQPRLPQRPRRVQPAPVQLGTGAQQLVLVARRGQRVDPHVVGEVEGGRVDPQRPAQPPPGPVQQLPQARHQVQPRLQPPADLVDPDAAVTVQQPGAVKDGQHADILGPAEVVRPQHEQVLGGQPFHRSLRIGARPSPLPQGVPANRRRDQGRTTHADRGTRRLHPWTSWSPVGTERSPCACCGCWPRRVTAPVA